MSVMTGFSGQQPVKEPSYILSAAGSETVGSKSTSSLRRGEEVSNNNQNTDLADRKVEKEDNPDLLKYIGGLTFMGTVLNLTGGVSAAVVGPTCGVTLVLATGFGLSGAGLVLALYNFVANAPDDNNSGNCTPSTPGNDSSEMKSTVFTV